ncbi:OpgC family protein [Roseibium limicola]|nr:OpgC domain-containing protein [Roseibium limicola]
MNANAHTSLPLTRQKKRDPRLDFFRGLGMFIIFVAHLPANWWALWIPARFGFSDATEIFVFCSGMASAIAFGKIFDTHGLGMGVARIAHRMWQVYWSHIALFLAIAAGLAGLHESGLLTTLGNNRDYVGGLNLWHFFTKTEMTLPGLLTLTYVPNYFDILPMYIVILALIPAVMALARLHLGAVAVFMIGLWLLATFRMIDLPAEPWSDRRWFFNPFAWQLVFFTGFAFMRGWLPRPPVHPVLIVLAALIVLGTVPFAYFRVLNTSEWLQDVRATIELLWIKSEFGILRYVHFLALAYLAWVAAGPSGKYLSYGPALWQGFVRVVQKVGQQSLAVFLASLVVAQSINILRDLLGDRSDWISQMLSNLVGFALLIAVAYTVSWFKSQPWRAPKTNPASPPISPSVDKL